VMENAIEDRRGDHVVVKDLSPFLKGFVGSNNRGSLLSKINS
jgi:hypothetical protein